MALTWASTAHPAAHNPQRLEMKEVVENGPSLRKEKVSFSALVFVCFFK